MNGDIISSILEIESSAKEKISHAEKLKKDIIRSAENEKKHIGDDMLQEAKERFKKLTVNERRSNDEKIAEINRRGDEEKARMDAVFKENRLKWEEKIFNGVIGV